MSPRHGQRGDLLPQMSIFNYGWSVSGSQCVNEQSKNSEMQMGDEAWVDPENAKCSSQLDKKTVTKVEYRDTCWVLYQCWKLMKIVGMTRGL